MLDWEGNMIEERDRVQVLLSDVVLHDATIRAASISKVEADFIDKQLHTSPDVEKVPIEAKPTSMDIPCGVDEVSSVLHNISSVLCPAPMASLLEMRGDIGRHLAAIGSANVLNSKYLVDDESIHSDDYSNALEKEPLDDNFWENLGEVTRSKIDLDAYMASSAHARPRKNITAEHLSKVWRIDLDTAKRTLDVTSQNCTRTSDPSLSRNYVTNDKMIRYKRN